MKVSRHGNLRLPDTLRCQLIAFRRRLWTLKLFEAAAFAIIAILVGFLLTYLLDRLHDTAMPVRGGILAAALLGSLAIPLAIHRWVLGRRRLDQLARLLAETRPQTGDPLLGVIELAEDAFDWKQSAESRSPQLIEAAIGQVARQVADQDLSAAIPNPRHRRRGMIAIALGLAAAALLLVSTPAVQNTCLRFFAPWKQTPRYTFADLRPLPESLVVAQDEPFNISLRLTETSHWRPATAVAAMSGQAPQQAQFDQQQYRFELPGQLSTEKLTYRVGDFRGQMRIEPKPRPELSSLIAAVELPEYLGREESVTKELRGSKFSVVAGSKAILTATASRSLDYASVNGAAQATAGASFLPRK